MSVHESLLSFQNTLLSPRVQEIKAWHSDERTSLSTGKHGCLEPGLEPKSRLEKD